MLARPSESITATVGTIVGAVLAILGAATKFELPVEVAGAIVTLVSFVASMVTAVIAKRQRAGGLGSKEDGKVSPS
jgi:hypothetical protein